MLKVWPDQSLRALERRHCASSNPLYAQTGVVSFVSARKCIFAELFLLVQDSSLDRVYFLAPPSCIMIDGQHSAAVSA